MVKNLPEMQETQVHTWVMKMRKMQPTSVFLPGEFHGQRTLEVYSPWGRKESDKNQWLKFSIYFLRSYNKYVSQEIFLYFTLFWKTYISVLANYLGNTKKHVLQFTAWFKRISIFLPSSSSWGPFVPLKSCAFDRTRRPRICSCSWHVYHFVRLLAIYCPFL